MTSCFADTITIRLEHIVISPCSSEHHLCNDTCSTFGQASGDEIAIPFDRTVGTTTIHIEGDETNGWVLTSSACQYETYYGPNGPEPVLRIKADNSLSITDGACGPVSPV